MAGSWILMRSALPDDLRVHALSELTELPPDAVVGKLLRFWAWANENTRDGVLRRATDKLVDDQVGHPGFASALRTVEWLDDDGDGSLLIPDFDVYNSKSAKNRARHTRIVGEQRTNQRRGSTDDQVSQAARTTRAPECAQPVRADCAPKERNKEREKETKKDEDRASARPPLLPRISWNPDDGWSGITTEHRTQWSRLYPLVPIDRFLATMDGWCRDNPNKRPRTKFNAALTRWLGREQAQLEMNAKDGSNDDAKGTSRTRGHRGIDESIPIRRRIGEP